MALDKVEAVKKVTETLSKESMNPAEQMDRVAPNKEQFQSLLDSSQTLKPSFQRIDTKVIAPEERTNVEVVEKKPVFAEENVSSQKAGTATDQERQRKHQHEVEEVGGVSATQKKSKTSKSLMDEVGNLNTNVSKMAQMTPEAIKNQAKDVIAQIDQVKTQLSQAQQTEIKPSYQTLLRNRLSHIDDNLKIALSKAGVEYTPPSKVTNPGKVNPIDRFINFLSNSQSQLENLHQTVDNLNMTGAHITPANMLAIQLKMGYVQQQIELFTSLLNKALESTKTIMNVQV